MLKISYVNTWSTIFFFGDWTPLEIPAPPQVTWEPPVLHWSELDNNNTHVIIIQNIRLTFDIILCDRHSKWLLITENRNVSYKSNWHFADWCLVLVSEPDPSSHLIGLFPKYEKIEMCSRSSVFHNTKFYQANTYDKKIHRKFDHLLEEGLNPPPEFNGTIKTTT